MKKSLSFFIVCFITLLVVTNANNAFAKQRVYPGFIVKFPNDNVKRNNTKSLFSHNNYKIKKSFKNYSLILPEDKTNIHFRNQAILDDNKHADALLLDYNENDDTCLKLKKLGAIECSPNYEFKISSVTPNDTYFSSQWGLRAFGTDATSAWSKTKGSKDVVVAIIDTGIDYTHRDLKDNLWVNPYEIPGNGIDDDNNGIIDDVHGANFIDDTGDPMDDNGHGTHVAGIVGAKGNNSLGVSGVNWNTSIISLKFLNDRGSGSLYNAIKAYEYLIDLKKNGINIKVVNNSWGGAYYTDALYTTMKNLANLGVVLVTAAGNDAEDNDVVGAYPANFDIENLISVASVDEDGAISHFSNIGVNTVDIAAPGGRIFSTYLNQTYASMSGTSMATPFITGAVALLLSHESTLSAKNVIDRIYNTGREDYGLIGLIRTERMLDIARLINNDITPMPQAPTCVYNVERVDYDNTNFAESQPIVQQADENNYYTLDLPFRFPFYGREYSNIVISPNGVVYLGYQPVSYDFSNKSTPPTNSIAALQTDLVAGYDPYGVRVYKSSDKVVIYWRAKHYSMQYADERGDIYLKLVLNSNGVIEDYISFYDTETLDLVATKSTIGISTRGTSALVYSYNDSSKLVNNLALKYTPICQEAVVFNVNDIDLYRINNHQKTFNNLKRNKKFEIALNGTGTGTVQAKVGFEFGVCQDLVNIKVKDGRAVVDGMLKMPVNYAKKLKIELPKYNLKTVRSIVQEKNGVKKYNKKKSKKQLKTRCKQLLNSIK